MIRTQTISLCEAWGTQPAPNIATSFQGGCHPRRIFGPARLMRLLSHAGQAPEGHMYSANCSEGVFWFDENDFLRIKQVAQADLKTQAGAEPDKMASRLGFYLRLQFRSLLAVSRNWSTSGSFDYFATLTIPAHGSVVCLMGQVAPQPVYDPKGISVGPTDMDAPWMTLPGGLTQFALRLDLPANRDAVGWIRSPFSF